MSGTVPLFRGTSGLNTVVDPVRLPYDRDTGISALAVAVNVVLDDTGRPSRRDGHGLVFDDLPAHSLFCDGGDCLFVAEDTLCQLLPDYTRVVLRTGLRDGARVDYAQVNADIYYTNTSQFGIVRSGGLHETWAGKPYVGPATNRVFSGPIPGEHIAFHAARVWLSTGQHAVYSEPFGWSWFDLTRNFVSLDSRVRMMKPVRDGMFMSSEKAIYFLKGRDPKEFELLKVATYPALEWSVAIDLIEGLEIGLQIPGGLGGLCALWGSPAGICLGMPDGSMINMTRDKVVLPENLSAGASLLRGYNLITTMK